MTGQKSTAVDYVWGPQAGPQHALVDCPVPEIFYGGARGGGKTDGVLGKYGIKAAKYKKGFNGIFFRKELPMLDDAIERSQEIYGPLGGKWNDQKKTWRMPGGGRLRFRPLERVQDADKYQGQNVTDCCVEEAGLYPDPRPIDRLNGVLRSATGVPTQLILTGNPGGAGQSWIKKRYIDPAPRGMEILERKLPTGKVQRRVFIPSRLENNKILTKNDPDYINRLYLVGSEQLVKAWLEGDWNAVEGAFFDCWTDDIVIKPFEIPGHWLKLLSFDWGSARPFSADWWAVASEDYIHQGKRIPRGAMVGYRQWYGCGEPNVGLKLTAEQVSAGIRSRQPEELDYAVADPAIFTEDGGPSIAERMQPIYFKRADNKRVATAGHIGGWDQLRQRMQGEDGRPMIYFFSTCVDSIRTLPVLQHDLRKPEDLDSDSEDHAADSIRYACMSRPWQKNTEEVVNTNRDKWADAFDDEGDSWKSL